MPFDSVRALMSGLIDYAGLFPPASLDLQAAVRKYVSYRDGAQGWVVGRFIVPAANIGDIRAPAAAKPVSLSALIGSGADADLEMVKSARVDTVELKAGTPAQIRSAAEQLPKGVTAYFEIPLAQDPRKSIEAIAEAGARAKVRTGGLTPDAFAGSRDLARFLHACSDANVAFKATAGLHHAVRSSHPVTDEPDAPSVVMHGFLNVFLAAAFVRAGMESVQVVRLLEDQSPGAFVFDQDSVTWRDESLDTEQIADARKNLAIAFGSCSFEEPVKDLKSLKLL